MTNFVPDEASTRFFLCLSRRFASFATVRFSSAGSLSPDAVDTTGSAVGRERFNSLAL